MSDKPFTIERFGIKHIPEDQRHGSTGRVFTLWFAANFTIAGGLVGVALAIVGDANFESFFEDFLLTLDYWITPWLAMILGDFFVLRRTTVESCLHARNWEVGVLCIYGLSILCSVPFMVPPSAIGWPVGSLAGWFGGADFSYYVSFLLAGLLYLLYKARASS